MTQLITRYEQSLYRFLLHLVGDTHLAEDLFQETFLRLHRARPDFDPALKLKPYLFQIAMNLARDARSRRAAAPASLDAPPGGDSAKSLGGALAAGLPAADPPPDGAAERNELRGRVRAAVAGLPELERVVVYLRVYEDLSFAEIARITAAPLPTVKSRMLYALRRLRPVLEVYLEGARLPKGITP